VSPHGASWDAQQALRVMMALLPLEPWWAAHRIQLCLLAFPFMVDTIRMCEPNCLRKHACIRGREGNR
jgi:hypothetical protein